jgi:uncharacterized protein YndB with AHSA1/START domain
MKYLFGLLALSSLVASPALAEVKSSSPQRFVLADSATIEGTLQQAWRRLTAISRWWSGDHTYSGNAANLSLRVEPGGCWCERWPQGAVEHARVLFVRPNAFLRIEGGFGPLQGMAVKAVMDFTLQAGPTPGQTVIKVSYVVNGVPESKLDALAPLVDQVLSEQMRRLSAVG